MKKSKKYIALILAFTIMVSTLPVSAFADEMDFYEP